MDAREYMRELDRMLRAEGNPAKYSKRECYRADCEGCPLYSDGTKMDFCGCFTLYDEAIDVVEKWAEANPRKTIQSVFLENYPNAPMSTTGDNPGFCAKALGYKLNCNHVNDCDECWRTPIHVLEER